MARLTIAGRLGEVPGFDHAAYPVMPDMLLLVEEFWQEIGWTLGPTIEGRSWGYSRFVIGPNDQWFQFSHRSDHTCDSVAGAHPAVCMDEPMVWAEAVRVWCEDKGLVCILIPEGVNVLLKIPELFPYLLEFVLKGE